MSSPESIAEAQAVEYGTYVACVDIFFDGARAYNIGHPVPVSNVEQHGYLDKGWVREVGTPEEPKPEPAPTAPAPQGAPIVVNETPKG